MKSAPLLDCHLRRSDINGLTPRRFLDIHCSTTASNMEIAEHSLERLPYVHTGYPLYHLICSISPRDQSRDSSSTQLQPPSRDVFVESCFVK